MGLLGLLKFLLFIIELVLDKLKFLLEHSFLLVPRALRHLILVLSFFELGLSLLDLSITLLLLRLHGALEVLTLIFILTLQLVVLLGQFSLLVFGLLQVLLEGRVSVL